MDWYRVFTLAASISGPTGLLCLFGALLVYLVRRSKKQALDQLIQAEQLPNSKELIRILATIKDEDRLAALTAVLDHDKARAEKLLARVEVVDIERLTASQQSHAHQVLLVVGGVLIVLAVLASVVTPSEVPKDSKRSGVLIILDKASSVIVAENERCDSPEPTLRLFSRDGSLFPLSRCGVVLGAEAATASQLKVREQVMGVAPDAAAHAVRNVDPNAIKPELRLECAEKNSYRQCVDEPLRLDTATHEEEGVWLVNVLGSCCS